MRFRRDDISHVCGNHIVCFVYYVASIPKTTIKAALKFIDPIQTHPMVENYYCRRWFHDNHGNHCAVESNDKDQ